MGGLFVHLPHQIFIPARTNTIISDPNARNFQKELINSHGLVTNFQEAVALKIGTIIITKAIPKSLKLFNISGTVKRTERQ